MWLIILFTIIILIMPTIAVIDSIGRENNDTKRVLYLLSILFLWCVVALWVLAVFGLRKELEDNPKDRPKYVPVQEQLYRLE